MLNLIISKPKHCILITKSLSTKSDHKAKKMHFEYEIHIT
jgi:hypothetical protein